MTGGAARDGQTSGVIIRAENGDVIGWDDSGLLLHLSDRVIADIAARLPQAWAQAGGLLGVQAGADQGHAPPRAATALLGAGDVLTRLGNIDAWAVQAQGDWLYFQANLPQADGPRGYMRHAAHPTILAQSAQPLMGIFAIGGARAQLGQALPSRYPYHLFAPADDIGAAGMGGEGEAQPTSHLLPLRELTHEALLAEALLDAARAAGQGLALFMLRGETDLSARAGDLASGPAMENLRQALQNHIAAAAHLGRPAQVAAICLDYCLEDLAGDATAYRDGIIAVMAQITHSLGQLGAPRPLFLAGFDCGTQTITDGPALAGQWELSWNHGDHPLVCTGPSYAYGLDDTGRLTDQGRRTKAELSAQALLASQAGERWLCPTLLLAERHGSDIRLTCAAQEGLVIDPRDPFQAGPMAGFRLDGVTNGARLIGVSVDPGDKRALLLRCSARPEGDVQIAYAFGAPPRPSAQGYAANAGALRDGWSRPGTHGPLHRWALPARLPLTPGSGG